MEGRSGGAVVAAHPLAAQAGAGVLGRGGNAVDAAVAAAFALAVVDPQNCGLGGHGGAMLVQSAAQTPPLMIDFNTAVPTGFDDGALRAAKRCGTFAVSGASVSIPAVLAGLECAHARFGKLAFGELLRPAIALARDGHPVSADLAHAIVWAALNHAGLSTEFRSVFCANGKPASAGTLLKQQDLARTLEAIAGDGLAAFYRGPIAVAVCNCVCHYGGRLSIEDLQSSRTHVERAEQVTFGNASVFGPHAGATGYGILRDALAALDASALGDNRSLPYARAVTAALRHGWQQRAAQARAIGGHTTHLCACDGASMLVSMTFTHGPTWFGSGLVAPSTGVVLNSGANLFVRPRAGDALYAVHNMSPVIVEQSCARHAIGSPGGSKIPAIVMQLVVDAVHYDLPLADAIKLPRVSVAPDGGIEAESALAAMIKSKLHARTIDRSEYYGPASALSLAGPGHASAALDPRFSQGYAEA